MALWRIRATVDDRPGYLSVLTASLALRGVNILTVQVHTTEAGAVDDFLVDAPDTLTEVDLAAAVTRGRGRDPFIVRAEAEGLVDQPTRALALAARLARDADALGDALAVLLGATDVSWRATAPPGASGFTADRMCLPDPVGGVYEVARAAPAFTPAEYARGQALVEVAAALQLYHAEHVTLLLPDGAELLIRPGGPHDVAAAAALHTRCSADNLSRRYLGGAVPASEGALRRRLHPVGGLCLVAARGGADGGGEELVAMASLVTEGELGEVSVLVADDWQRRGIGTALVRRVLDHAGYAGLAAVVAHTPADDVAMLRTLRRIGATGDVVRDGPMVTITVPISAAVPA